jgi:hypothetical protein
MKIPRVWTEPFKDLISDRLRSEAAKKFRIHQLPDDKKTWAARKKELAARIWGSLGVSVDHSLDLDRKETAVIKMDGCTVRNICFQSRPGIYVTGNLYVPDGKKRFPAVLNMHGHWSQGRLAERVQSRGHSLARSGYVCLCVDAWGSGERSTEHGNYEYHGGNLGASLLSIGETLMGAQVADNMRAVDLLCSLDFVDNKKIGATGASGGGNQTMWLAALDERIAAAVPVVSVGSFESYVMRQNCVCELLPDGLLFTEESGVLALAAPRALKICNCLQDANPTFFVGEMLRSFKEARRVYRALNAYDKLAYQAFDLPHGYWPEIREAMLGWFDLHLKGEGSGMPKEEPAFEALPEEKLMVFKKGKRDKSVVTIAGHCRKTGADLRGRMLAEKSFDTGAKADELRDVLKISKWLTHEKTHEYSPEGEWRKFAVESSCGEIFPLLAADHGGKASEFVVFAHPYGKENVSHDAISAVLKQRKGVILTDLWGSGETHSESTPNYHVLARGALWLGKSMQGEWTRQLDLIFSFVKERFSASKISVHAYKECGAAALFLSAIKQPRHEITLEESPVSYLFNKKAPPDFLSMAFHLPGIMKWGDISLAAAMSGARIKFISPVFSDGQKLTGREKRAWEKEFAILAARCGRKSETKLL